MTTLTTSALALPESLNGVGLKLARFEEHNVPLEEAMETFRKSQPYRLVTEVKADGFEHWWYAVDVKHPDPHLGVVIGDAIHNLRSCLDHLAWQLAKLTGPPPRGTEFPIFKDSAKFLAVDGSGLPERGSGLYKIRGWPKAAQTIVQDLQPFQRSNAASVAIHPLWLLQELSNQDKHHLLAATVAAGGGGASFVPLNLVEERWGGGPLKEHAVVLWRRFSVPTPNMEVDPVTLVAIHFEVPGPWSGLTVPITIARVHRGVVEAVQGLRGFFP